MENHEKPNFGYIYPRPAVTTDCVIFGFDMTDRYALPGGFIKIEAKTNEYGLVVEEKNESLLECAKRELKEETGFDVQNIYELGTWSTPGVEMMLPMPNGFHFIRCSIPLRICLTVCVFWLSTTTKSLPQPISVCNSSCASNLWPSNFCPSDSRCRRSRNSMRPSLKRISTVAISPVRCSTVAFLMCSPPNRGTSTISLISRSTRNSSAPAGSRT